MYIHTIKGNNLTQETVIFRLVELKLFCIIRDVELFVFSELDLAKRPSYKHYDCLIYYRYRKGKVKKK